MPAGDSSGSSAGARRAVAYFRTHRDRLAAAIKELAG
jgi:hypothetical protein